MVNDDDDMSADVIACAVICQVISGLFVAARFYSRGVVTRALAREDYCILTAWILGLGYTVPSIIATCVAQGRHIWTVSPEDWILNQKMAFVDTIFYQFSLLFSKMSILLLYIRILAYTYARRAAFALLAIVVIYNVLSVISIVTICIPLAAFWDDNVEGHCHPASFMWAVIGLHITTDFLIFLLPMPVVFRMTSPLSQKISLLVAFALGFIVCLVSILRAIRIRDKYDTKDVTWDYVAISNWTAVEINISVLVPCLIVLKPLLVKIFPGLTTPHQSNSPHDVPHTIGSDPTDRGRAHRGADHAREQSQKSLVYHFEHQNKDRIHVDDSGVI